MYILPHIRRIYLPMFFLRGWFQLLQNIVYTRCSTRQPAEPEVIGLLETILINIQTNLETNPIIDNQPTSQPKTNNLPTSQPKTDNQPTRTPTFKSVNY